MPPKKKASTKKASFKGGHTASKSKSAKFKATATTSNKKTGPSKDKAPKDKTPKDKAPKDDAAAGFPQFSRFPVEIQQEIFTQALRKPSIHFMTVERAVERGSLNDAGVWVDYAWPTWHLTYHPKPKSSDTSGHRVNKTIGAVSHAARHAVVLATKNPGNLPFGRSWGPMDADNDLVALDFLPGATQHAKSDFRYFHVNNQFHPPYYDPDKSFPAGRSRVKKDGKSVVRSALTDEPSGMADLRRVGVVYKRVPGRVCGSRNTVFQCCVHDGDDDDDDDAGIGPHGDWTMCPEEVAGFIDSVPALEEFYFVVQVPHGDKEDQARLEMYKKWFFSTYHEQIRLEGRAKNWLTMFHDADKTYIEVDRYLMLEASEMRQMDLDIVREVRELVKAVHKQLTLDDDTIPSDMRRIYRTPLEKRQAMVYKILLPVGGV